MSFVLDNSVTMRWCFGDGKPSELEYATEVAKAMRTDSALVPAIWALEVANVLARGEHRGEIPQDHSNAFLQLLRTMRIETDPAAGAFALTDTLGLARRHHLSAYEAAYLELARRKQISLATLDTDLRKAAKRAGVALFRASRSD